MAKKSFFRRFFYYGKKFAWLFFAPLLCLFCTELVQQGNLNLIWQTFSHSLPYFGLAYLVLFFLSAFIFLISNHAGFTVFLLSLSTFLLSFADHFKVLYRHEPLTFTDLNLWRESLTISNSYQIYLFPAAIISLILLSTNTIFVWMKGKKISSSVTRIWSLLLLSFFALLLYFGFFSRLPASFATLQLDYQFRNQTWDDNSSQHGFLPTFIIESFSDVISRPLDYSAKKIAHLVEQTQQTFPASPEASCAAAVQPDVIVIMNESFIDFDRFTSLDFSPTLIPNFTHLQQTQPHGQLLVKTYGGGTAETEFEVLTGMSTAFHPRTSIAYNQLLKQNLPTALPALFAAAGYQTTALHPNDAWFFNRDQAYQHLGFQKFHTLPDFVTPVTLRGNGDNQTQINNVGFVSDATVANEIIHLTQAHQQEASPSPQFIFAVTIQNHGYYHDKTFSQKDYQQLHYRFQPENLLDQDQNVEADLHNFDNYLVSLHDADIMLQKLLRHYQDQDRPTLIVFFGDHFPGFDQNFSNLIAQNQTLSIFSAPFVIWSNYLPQPDVPDYQTLSAFQLAPLILQSSCQSLPPFYQFLQNHRAQLPGYNTAFNLLPNQTIISHTDLTPELKALKNNHWLWQYDLLFGQQYSLN